jgi:hypothetical protein
MVVLVSEDERERARPVISKDVSYTMWSYRSASGGWQASIVVTTSEDVRVNEGKTAS